MKNTILRLLLLSIAVLNWSACSCLRNGGNPVQRTDSVAVHHNFQTDSVRIERTRFVFVRGDTVFVRDTLLRERVHTRIQCDTLWREREVYIEKPIRYVPRFYKGCAGAIGVLLLAIGWWCIWKIKG